MSKMRSIVVFLVALSLVVFSSIAFAEIDPNIPQEWYQAPKAASDYGVASFSQSPMLQDRVLSGDLPPVEQRLPEDPPVIKPYDKVGKYGGMLNVWAWQETIGDPWGTDPGTLVQFTAGFEPLTMTTPDAREEVPYLVKGWSYSDNYKEFTLYLRKGLKWSDGYPVTADDVMFWWNHVANNKELMPSAPKNWDPPVLDVERIDDFTVKFTLGKSMPFYHRTIKNRQILKHPAHYMKQFHPDFVDKDKLLKEAQTAGLSTWYEYYNYKHTPGQPQKRGQRPLLSRYVPVKNGGTYVELERNPYFPFVDTKGNQLPYIDKVRMNGAGSQELMTTKTITGEADFDSEVSPEVIPALKQNGPKAGYRTLMYDRVGSVWTIWINMTNKDPKLRSIFSDKRFRQALSLAIDRNEINQKVYFGMGTIGQRGLIPSSKYINEGDFKAFTDFDTDRANKLLDEMGMKDVNGDGFREYPDGSQFIMRLENWDTHAVKHAEIIMSNWKNVGINTDFKTVTWEANFQRRQANETQLFLAYDGPVADKNFEIDPSSLAPIAGGWRGNNMWPAYKIWYDSGGERGMEPPANIKELHDLAQIVMYSTDDQKRLEAGKKLSKAQAENLWAISTIPMFPSPVVVDSRLKNVYETGIFGPIYGLVWTSQVYFDE